MAEAPPAEGEAEAVVASGNTNSSTAAPATVSTGHLRGAGDLAELLRRRRAGCEEWESTPGSSTADVGASIIEVTDGGAGNEGRSEVLDKHMHPDGTLLPKLDGGAQAVDLARRGRGHRTSESELRDWMANMRRRCEILESTPNSTTADAKNEDATRFEDRRENQADEVKPARPATPPPAEAPKPPEPSPSPPAVPSSTPAAAAAFDSAELLSVRMGLREAIPLSDESRVQVWSAVLLREPGRGAPGPVLPALAHLLGTSESGSSCNQGDEEVLFDASTSQSPSGGTNGHKADCSKLASAFSEKYVAILSGTDAGASEGVAAGGAPVYALLAQLLRYHHPAAACAIEAVSLPVGFGLVEVLGVVCGGPAGLAQCLLTPHGEREADALLLFCDLVVVEEEEWLLLMVAVVLLREVVPEPGTSFEHVKELVRGRHGLGGLGSRGPDGACQCVAAARALLEATPVSLMSALSGGSGAGTRLKLAVCAVLPDEVLHHAYEGPAGSWRFVAVDVRMRASRRALPVCVRLGRTQHTQRRQTLRELAYEESLHICLLGDGPVAPGDDAFELCRYLTGPSVQRKHVSVVDGGWPAVEELADSLRLHLMPVEPEEEPAEPRGPARLREARAAVVEVVGHVASATETATAVGHKVAQRMMKGAGRLLGSEIATGRHLEAMSDSNAVQ